ncbi:hypothetical protein K435DRAFT_817267 [Dendrothele bispora CBS 962.96]|uniref:Uncharacterized protein n=1 Tax=Dendrothele bispora (strain CBS 962.96) TaxID=1314807 RepID=A0A4S8MKW0_DENBC|nr:hypothetical protein K435DRAFT_817267 [Dendrothele bispora CBS 962.96]
MGLGPIGVIGSQPAIYLTQANLDSVPFEGFMANGFAAGGQRTATANVENFQGSPTRILGLELMEKFCEQPHHFCTPIITETQKPIYPTEDEESETVDKVIVATDEEAYWQSGISARAVFDGAVPIFRSDIGGDDSAAEEATYTSHPTKYSSHLSVIVCHNELCTSKIMAKRLMNNPKITILWNTVATERQGDREPLKNLRIKNVQTDSEKDLAVTNPQRRSFRTQLQTDTDGYIVAVPGADSNFSGDDKGGCMATLEAERLIAEEDGENGIMMGE